MKKNGERSEERELSGEFSHSDFRSCPAQESIECIRFFIPENDRVRYTVCDSARRQILQELLKLNHERHKEEVAAGLVDENGKVLKKKGKKDKGMDDEGPGLF